MAGTLCVVGDEAAARQWLDAARARAVEGMAPQGWRSTHSAAWALEATLGLKPQTSHWLNEGRHVVDVESDPRLAGWALSRLALGCALVDAGHDEGIELLQTALARSRSLDVPASVRLRATGKLALALLGQGGLEPARRLLGPERATVTLLERDLGSAAAKLVVTLRLAEGLLAQRSGDLMGAQYALTRAAEHARAIDVPHYLAAAESALAAMRPGVHEEHAPSTSHSLTDRERNVLLALAGQLSQRSIAAELNLSRGQMKATVAKLYRRLNANSRAEAVSVASAAFLIPDTPVSP